MKIIDNALNSSLLSAIQEVITSLKMPWYFIENSVDPAETKLVKAHPLNYSFHHLVLNKASSNTPLSPFDDMTTLISLILKDLFELEKTSSIYRLRWGMTTTLNKIHRHNPHIDYSIPHKVILFYLNASDGDTDFYDKDLNIIDSVTPKENRAVLFDGSILHSSSKPIEFSRRIVLNINIIE